MDFGTFVELIQSRVSAKFPDDVHFEMPDLSGINALWRRGRFSARLLWSPETVTLLREDNMGEKSTAPMAITVDASTVENVAARVVNWLNFGRE